MNKNVKKRKKIKINFFNLFILASVILAGFTLLHDLLVWGIIPLFTGHFYCLTYFGMLVDLAAVFILEAGFQVMEEWFNEKE